MPFRRPASLVSLALFCLISLVDLASAQSEVPGVGSWRLNVSKSKLGTNPPPQSSSSKIESIDGHAKVTGVMVAADGIRSEARYKAKLDGKDYPILGHPNADTISLKKIDARTVERVDKRGGKVVETSTTVFSEDGKTSTTTGKAKNFQGHDFQYVVIHEKQP